MEELPGRSLTVDALLRPFGRCAYHPVREDKPSRTSPRRRSMRHDRDSRGHHRHRHRRVAMTVIAGVIIAIATGASP